MMNQNPNQSNGEGTLLEFPCRFAVKAMGRQTDQFQALVEQIVMSHAELWPGEAVTTTSSKGGKYLSVTVVVEATSQQQMDALYQDLTDCAEVLMAL